MVREWQLQFSSPDCRQSRDLWNLPVLKCSFWSLIVALWNVIGHFGEDCLGRCVWAGVPGHATVVRPKGLEVDDCARKEIGQNRRWKTEKEKTRLVVVYCSTGWGFQRLLFAVWHPLHASMNPPLLHRLQGCLPYFYPASVIGDLLSGIFLWCL